MIPDMKTQIIEVHTGGRETVRDITSECADFASAAAEGGRPVARLRAARHGVRIVPGSMY